MAPRNHPDPWLALDATTSPARRARELARDWERFLSAGDVDGVRPPVAESWRRSVDAGVDPSGRRLPAVAVEHRDATTLFREHPLSHAAELIRDCLAGIAGESEHLIVVSDAAGMLLDVEGDVRVRSRAADLMNFSEGALWTETSAGTNAIGTALAADHAVEIFATEHFLAPVQAWTCSAAPVHDPETRDLLGVIDLTGLRERVHPQSMAIVMTTARAVESYLRQRLLERDALLRARYGARLGAGRDRRALAAPTGRLIADDPRGWLGASPLELPPGGGDLLLPSGELAIAEPLGAGEVFLVRQLSGSRAPRDPLGQVAAEQAALRRLATAVAQGVPPDRILRAVADEIRPLLGVDDAAVVRYDADGTATILAGSGAWLEAASVSMRVAHSDSLVINQVFRTGRSARTDNPDHSAIPGPIGAYLRRVGIRSAVASPVTVDRHLWGAMAASTRRELLPANIEERMANFTELVGVVIANAESRAEIQASRARVVAAADEARRRIQRDLHDGAQQRLVVTIMALKEAHDALADTSGEATELVDAALMEAEEAVEELRELAQGILPPALGRGGLRAAIDALVTRLPLPVTVDITPQRLPAALEAAAYFIVAEALTNTVKHARADRALVTAVVDGRVLRLVVRDDGVGGAVDGRGSGLVGLRDRAEALNGELRIHSPAGKGTVIAAFLPIAGEPQA